MRRRKLRRRSDLAFPLDEEGAGQAVTETSGRVHRAVAGDLESLGWLVRRFTPLMLAQAESRLTPILRRHCDPEDLVQDAWVVVMRRIGALQAEDGRGKGALIRYICSVLLHRARDLARLAVVRAGSPESVSRRPEKEDGSGMQSDMLARMIAEERRSGVRAAIDGLAEADRKVVVLRGLEGHPVQEVSTLIGTTPNAVSIRYHRALQRLRTQLPDTVFAEMAED